MKKHYTDISDIPLRERKHAETKLKLVRAMTERLHTRRFEEIKTKELCDEVSISEVTFYKYFPVRESLMLYFIELWGLQVRTYLKQKQPLSALKEIEELFLFTADLLKESPPIMGEIISLFARRAKQIEVPEISRVDAIMINNVCGRHVVDPDIELVSIDLEEFLKDRIEQAQAEGELDTKLQTDTVARLVAAVFFGVPLMLGREGMENLRKEFEASLNLLWGRLRGGKGWFR